MTFKVKNKKNNLKVVGKRNPYSLDMSDYVVERDGKIINNTIFRSKGDAKKFAKKLGNKPNIKVRKFNI